MLTFFFNNYGIVLYVNFIIKIKEVTFVNYKVETKYINK